MPLTTQGRWQSKMSILSTNVDKKSLETEFLIVICGPAGDIWQLKTLFLLIFYPRLSIVKNVLDFNLPGVLTIPSKLMYDGNWSNNSTDTVQICTFLIKSGSFKCPTVTSKTGSRSPNTINSTSCLIVILLIQKISQGFYFDKTSHVRSFVKIKSLQNAEITLSFTNICKWWPCRKFLASQICLLTLFAKIKFSQKFLDLQYPGMFCSNPQDPHQNQCLPCLQCEYMIISSCRFVTRLSRYWAGLRLNQSEPTKGSCCHG